MSNQSVPLIFEQSCPDRYAKMQAPTLADESCAIPDAFLRTTKPLMAETSEMQVVRHYTLLSQRNFSIDTHFYPLGSCTMKYNPRGVQRISQLPGFVSRHPLAPMIHSQGFLSCIYELQEILKEAVGMKGISLAPLAGAQGEFVGVSMIRAYHEARGDSDRTEILVPDAAHGTNPASAIMCGYKVREIPTNAEGDVDFEALENALGPQTAGIMLTNPSTLGVFERQIKQIAEKVHQAGGLLYYDGANLNAILGRVRPGDMGFDVMHMNLHKTFATPHGGGGPGSGPVAVGHRLVPYLPIPMVIKEGEDYRLLTEKDCPDTIGPVTTFIGNAGILLRAYLYARILGREGMRRVSEFATLNANYLMVKLQEAGFELAFKHRRATHEFIITLQKQAKQHHVTAMDIAKRLLDYGCHAPTTYFPLLVPECFLIEPTETESKEDIEEFIDALISISKEIEENPELVTTAPHTLPVKRMDEVKAAKELDVCWKE